MSEAKSNIVGPILAQLDSHPRRLAVCEPGNLLGRSRSIDCGDLRQRIIALATDLGRRGLGPGERVVLQIPNGVELAAATLAVLHLGGVPVLCEPGIGDEVYLSRLRLARARWLLVHPLLRRINGVPGLRRLLRRHELEVPPLPGGGMTSVTVSQRILDRLAESGPADTAPARRGPDDLALVVFTGGTTSQPKGVCLTHGALEHYLSNIASVISGLPMERLVTDTLPQVLYALRFGCSAFVTRGRRRRRARLVLGLVQRGEVDAYFGAPYIWKEMKILAGGQRARLPATLKTVLLGSAPVTRAFLDSLVRWLDPATQVLAIYGLTEAGPVSAVSVPDKLAFAGEGDLVGAPLSGVRIEIQGAGGEDHIGEVVVHSPSLYSGYLGQDPRPAEEGLRTGDLGRMVQTGGGPALALMGRHKDMIIRRSVNIYPGTLDPLLRTMQDQKGPLVQEGVLVGLWNEARQDEEVVLCVEPAQGRERVDAEALRREAARITGPDASPDRVMIVDSMPVKGRQNKIDKAALRARASEFFGLTQDSSGAGPLEGPSTWDRPTGALMPFDWSALVSKYLLLLQRERAPAAVAGQLAFRLALYGAGQTSWLLDEVAARGWRQTEMRGPLFILGHQRSGTTLLQRLLVQDQPHTCALTLHEMLLPAISWQRGISRIASLGTPLNAGFANLQERLFGPMDKIHRIRFDEVEEDEFALWTIFASAMCVNDAPSSTEYRELDRLRQFHGWPVHRQAKALQWYRACLQKKLFREAGADGAPARWVVSKNPAFTHKVPELLRVFPDARFVYLVRDPRETIPSRLSLIREIWRQRFSGFHQMSPAQVEVILDDSLRTYRAAEQDLAQLPGARCLTVRYTDLVADPRGVAEQVFAHFGLPEPGPGLAAAVERLANHKGRGRTSKHQYSLGEFGLSQGQIRRALATVFQRHGYDQAPDAASPAGPSAQRAPQAPEAPPLRLLLVFPKNLSVGLAEMRFVSHILGRSGLMNVSLATVAALTPPPFQVTIVDENVQPIPHDASWDLVGITGFHNQLDRAREIAETFSSRGIPVVCGGPSVTISPERWRPFSDVLIIGEAEEIWARFIDDFVKGAPAAEYRAPQRPDLSLSPLPDYSGFGNQAISGFFSGIVQTSRGCPYDCEFCDVIVYVGRKMRYKPVSAILKEVEQIHRLGLKVVVLADDNFAGHRGRAKEILRALGRWNRAQRQPLSFITQLSLDVAQDREFLTLAAEAGLNRVCVGIESVNRACLKEAHKTPNLRLDMAESLKRFHQHGIMILGTTIVGFDNDGLTVFQELFDFLMAVGVVSPQVFPLQAPDGTPLKARMIAEGRYLDWDTTADSSQVNLFNTATIVPKQMTVAQLQQGTYWLMWRLYTFDNMVQRVERFLQDFEDSPHRGAIDLPGSFVDREILGILGRLLRHLFGEATAEERRFFRELIRLARHSSHPQRFAFAINAFLTAKNVQSTLLALNPGAAQTGYPSAGG